VIPTFSIYWLFTVCENRKHQLLLRTELTQICLFFGAKGSLQNDRTKLFFIVVMWLTASSSCSVNMNLRRSL